MSDKTDNREEDKKERKPVEVYAERAETKAPEISQEEMQALASAYAKYLAGKNLKPGEATFVEPEELMAKEASDAKETAEVKPAAAIKETADSRMQALASEYAKMLKESGLKPGDEIGAPPKHAAKPAEEKKQAAKPAGKSEAAKKEEIMTALEETTARYKKNPPKKEKKQTPSKEDRKAAKAEKSKQKKTAKQAKRKAKAQAAAEKRKDSGATDDPFFRTGKIETALASALDTHDRIQDRQDESLGRVGKGFVKGAHDIASTYTHSRKQIGIGLLIVGVLAAGILILFDSFTVYEYAYNGKVLGYVKEQEEVTEVLEIAGEKLSQNNGGIANVEFVANQNVTFSPVDGRGKSTDDMDTAVNKLIYMTDIETEAYAVCDGNRVVAIVKDEESAETLLADTLAALSRPDSGMELVSAEFVNELSVKPVNVMLGSVQSNGKALGLMTKGGDMEVLHIVEEGETIESIAEVFGVDTVNIFIYGDEKDSDTADEESSDTSDEEDSDTSGEEDSESADEESGDTSDEEDSESTDEESGDTADEEDSDTSGEEDSDSSDEESGSSDEEKSSSSEEKTATVEEGSSAGEIQQGDMVLIKSSVEPVAVKMVEKGKMKEVIEYETIKKKSDEYYQGDTHLEQEGRNGTQIFEGTLTKVSGEVVDRDEISTTVIKEKKDKIILVGTKERPKTAPTGTYAMPLEHYTVTSEFGWRWGRAHTGIDLAIGTGTPVYASDGGTVVRAGWFGGYGNCVDIDHGNGRVTRYGHNSALLVSVGDKVYQGQEISLVGSTGNSTGPHLHFEIILDGTQHNPREFMDF